MQIAAYSSDIKNSMLLSFMYTQWYYWYGIQPQRLNTTKIAMGIIQTGSAFIVKHAALCLSVLQEGPDCTKHLL